MTCAFYLTGQDRSGVVGVKVQKVRSFIFLTARGMPLLEYLQQIRL